MADPSSDVPGSELSLKDKVVLGGSRLLETRHPLNNVCEHVCAFHMYAHDMARVVEAHHYCSHLSKEVRQCLLYDSAEPGARLIGVEFMVSASVFEVRAHECFSQENKGTSPCPLPEPARG